MEAILEAPKKERLYKTSKVLSRKLRISYPTGKGRMILRTEQDWDKDIEAISVSEDRNTYTFALEVDQPFLYFKPILVSDDGVYHWATGANKLLLMEENSSWQESTMEN